ncbi:prolipoprotein diacylglyceryl transferase [Granulicella cerasi]|uniref:Prolipoprotein diacylglyceryl transferase n=1 Tax=Granulicella cerasi TaxID=741063 RepID=A0ABW1Z6W0_9BACT|nr:prolipoprotein diacylglyceryl transferase [Granulicella cerasi]
MFPYIHIGSFQMGTFGLLLWLAAVCATWVLHRNFVRNGVNADALNIVAIAVVAGILGAKAWHELQNPAMIAPELRGEIIRAGGNKLLGTLHWFQAGFAWFGGLLASIVVLIAQGVMSRPNGLRGGKAAWRMLDLAAPAAAIGYGVGRIGCLTSGDGDYGKPTTLPWGVHMRPDALVPTSALVQPTPVYEFLFAVVLGWWLWKRGSRPLSLGLLTGEYLLLSGIGRFLVEFERINPRLYMGMSNAQVAALGSAVVGAVIMLLCRRNEKVVPTVAAEEVVTSSASNV